MSPTTSRGKSGRSCRHYVPARDRSPQPDPVLIAALRRTHAMLVTERGMPLIDAAPRSA